MPQVIPDATTAVESTPSIDAGTTLDTIGIELEYPIADNPDEIPVARGSTSRNLRRDIGRGTAIHADGAPTGQMTGDHVGAEIVSVQMDLHSDEPESWYNAMIREAQDRGYPFAPTGYGETNFGLHMHMSNVLRPKAEGLVEISREPWFRAFVCTSMTERSADPWRHGGVTSNDLEGQHTFRQSHIMNDYPGTGHYEWRLPEPMLPEHLSMVMHFLRLLDTEGVETARNYARDAVYNADRRLTAVQQFLVLDEDDDWRDRAMTDRYQTDPDVAREIIDIFSSALDDD